MEEDVIKIGLGDSGVNIGTKCTVQMSLMISIVVNEPIPNANAMLCYTDTTMKSWVSCYVASSPTFTSISSSSSEPPSPSQNCPSYILSKNLQLPNPKLTIMPAITATPRLQLQTPSSLVPHTSPPIGQKNPAATPRNISSSAIEAATSSERGCIVGFVSVFDVDEVVTLGLLVEEELFSHASSSNRS